MEKDRLAAFSDGVIAVVITIMVPPWWQNPIANKVMSGVRRRPDPAE